MAPSLAFDGSAGARRCGQGIIGALSVLAMGAACRSQYVTPASPYSVATLPNSWTILAREGSVVALDPDGLLRWTTNLPKRDRITTPITAAADGTVYLRGRSMLHSLAPDGKWRWTKKIPGVPDRSPPEKVSIYAPIALSDSTVAMLTERRELTAFTYEGNVRWERYIPGDGDPVAPPRCASNGQIIVPTTAWIFAISPVGHLDWRAARKP